MKTILKNLFIFNEKWYQSVIPWLLLLITITILLVWEPFLVDDAYISFRYADRLAAGEGFSWNINEPAIEGYSNPLFVFLLTLFSLLGFSLDQPAFYLNGLFLIGTAFIIYWFARITFKNDLLGFSLATAFMISSNILLSGLMGLETSLYGFLITLALCCYIVYKRPNHFICILRVILLFFISITRFEGFLLAILIYAAFFIIHYKEYKTENKLILLYAEGGILLFLIGMIFLFRFIIFEEWIPLTVYAKGSGVSHLIKLEFATLYEKYLLPGFSYIIDFFKQETHLLFAATILTGATFVKPRLDDRTLIPLLGLVYGLSVILLNAGDWMKGYRLLTPFAGLLIIGMLKSLSNLQFNAKQTAIAAAIFMLFYPILTKYEGMEALHLGDFSLNKYTHHRWNEIGEWMGRISTEEDLALIEQIGRIGYYGSTLNIVDFQGLVNKHVAIHGEKGSMFGKRMDDYCYSLYPSFIESNSRWTIYNAIDYYQNTPGEYNYLYLIDPNWHHTYLLIREDVILREGFSLPNTNTVLVDADIAKNILYQNEDFYHTYNEAVQQSSTTQFYPIDQIIEAENGIIINAEIKEDIPETMGKYVINGQIIFHFNVMQAGQFQLKLKILAKDRFNDSYFVQIDNEEPRVWHFSKHSMNWQWVISEFQWDLTIGPHTLYLKHRESTPLDQLMLQRIADD